MGKKYIFNVKILLEFPRKKNVFQLCIEHPEVYSVEYLVVIIGIHLNVLNKSMFLTLCNAFKLFTKKIRTKA